MMNRYVVVLKNDSIFEYFYFVKQKTAYEMRISDWSSDVCSSDLMLVPVPIADLYDAQAVARGDEPHGFSVDGDRAVSKHAFGQILFVEMDCHEIPLSSQRL